MSETGSQKRSKSDKKDPEGRAKPRPLKPTNKAKNYIRATQPTDFLMVALIASASNKKSKFTKQIDVI